MDASLLSKFERSVECNICQDPVEDPRVLPCQHTYCRFCIDDLLKFDENGAATVKCQNNCNSETLIKQNETTKILPKNFALSNVLDLITESKQSNVNNGKTKCLCKSKISKWCISCKVMLCNGCYQTHECNHKSFINGSYNLANENFQPLCEDHDAHIKHVCLDCNYQFICCYCVHREHRLHKIDTLDQTANKYKQEYLANLDNINGDDLDFSYDDAITNVFKFEEELEMELNARIHLKVSSYIKKLIKEKDEILYQYKNAAESYKQSLNDSELTHKTFKESLESAKEYLKQQSAFETLALKEDLNKQMESITKLNVFKVSLNEDENSDSLGTLKTEIMKKDLSEGNIAFDHDINLKNKDDYVDILCGSNLLIENLLKTSKRLLLSSDEGKRYQRFNTKDINELISNNDIQTLKTIIFINPQILSDNLSCLIYLTIQHNQSNILDLLLKYYPDAVDIKDDNNDTPLLYAVEEGSIECVNVLLQNNANIQVTDNDGNTCLQNAAFKGYHKIINILLNHGADVNSKGCNGRTPLMKAAMSGHKECVKILLENNADVNVGNDNNNTCLHDAAENGHHEIINILLNHGADVNSKGFSGRTALMWSAMYGHKECVNILSQNNADVDLKSNINNTCLHYAASNDHNEIITTLINHGADINSKGYNGQTPLMYAAMYGHIECVNILLQNNADVDLKDNYNNTCLHHAASRGYHEIKNILLNHMKLIDSETLNILVQNGAK